MKNPKVGVGVLIVNNKGETLLGKRIGSHEDSTHELAYYREQVPSLTEEDMNKFIRRYIK